MGVDQAGRDAAAGGAAGLRGLELLPPGMPPPISSTTVRRVVPMGIFHKAGVVDLAAQGEHLVPLASPVPMLANQSAPFRMICGMLA